MDKRILVTGGAGFLGSHLCEELLKQGNEVLCVDNLFTGSKKNIVHLLKNWFRVIKYYRVDFIWLSHLTVRARSISR